MITAKSEENLSGYAMSRGRHLGCKPLKDPENEVDSLQTEKRKLQCLYYEKKKLRAVVYINKRQDKRVGSVKLILGQKVRCYGISIAS